MAGRSFYYPRADPDSGLALLVYNACWNVEYHYSKPFSVRLFLVDFVYSPRKKTLGETAGIGHADRGRLASRAAQGIRKMPKRTVATPKFTLWTPMTPMQKREHWAMGRLGLTLPFAGTVALLLFLCHGFRVPVYSLGLPATWIRLWKEPYAGLIFLVQSVCCVGLGWGAVNAWISWYQLRDAERKQREQAAQTTPPEGVWPPPPRIE